MAFGLLAALAQQLFKRAIYLLDQTRECEKEQMRDLILYKRHPENPAAALEEIKVIELGARADLSEHPVKASSRNSVQRKTDAIPASQE